MRVIGTAGHVDHGKSTLVEALTGSHPDRLKEEREREMTIDLGFAWLTLPDGEEVGIIDVPGHRDFIENMLAGVGGIDAALFVIAADEGVMPQTREHLAILDLLEVGDGVVALTKIDMVDDEGWLDLIEEDIRQTLRGTVLEKAPILRVSGRKRTGLPDLLEAIAKCLRNRPTRQDIGKPRLPIDRVFTMSGFGTVVTGTLSDGFLKAGEEIEVLPQGVRGRIRGLQTHRRKEETAVPGSRTAVNISGVNMDQVQRGDVLAHPKSYRITTRFDARFRELRDASSALRHNTEVKVFIGASEVLSRVKLLGKEEIKPGETGWIQLELSQPVVVVRGDHYILRKPSPGETLGGGVVLDAHPKGRHKRFAADTLTRLEALDAGTPTEILQQASARLGVAALKDVITHAGLDGTSAEQAVNELTVMGLLINLEGSGSPGGKLKPDTLVATTGTVGILQSRAIQEIGTYHRNYPLRRGMPREELKSRLKLQGRVFNGIISRLVGESAVSEEGPLVRLPDHKIRFTPQQQRGVDSLLERFAASLFSPPTVKDSQSEVGDDVYQALVELGQLVQVANDVAFSRAGYDRMVAEVRQLIKEQGEISAAQVRDHFNTSRRYALALLEHLDSQGVTVRDGDIRRLKS